MKDESIEIRSDKDVADEIRSTAKKLNQLIIEAEKEKGLKVEISIGKNNAISGPGIVEVTGIKITKVL